MNQTPKFEARHHDMNPARIFVNRLCAIETGVVTRPENLRILAVEPTLNPPPDAEFIGLLNDQKARELYYLLRMIEEEIPKIIHDRAVQSRQLRLDRARRQVRLIHGLLNEHIYATYPEIEHLNRRPVIAAGWKIVICKEVDDDEVLVDDQPDCMLMGPTQGQREIARKHVNQPSREPLEHV